MTHFITTTQAARELADGFERQAGARPTITAQKVETLVHTGVFTNADPSGARILLSRRQVADFLDRTTYVPDYAAFGIQDPIFRVSVVEQRDNPVYDVSGKLLRQYSGFDYSNPGCLSAAQQRGGYEGAWSISDANAEYLVETRGYLVPTTKGYVRGDNVRRIADYSLVKGSPRKYFHTEALAESDPFYADATHGFWIDVRPGRESGIDFDPGSSSSNGSASGPAGEAALSLEELIELIELNRRQIGQLKELIELNRRQIGQLEELIGRKEAEEERKAQDEDDA